MIRIKDKIRLFRNKKGNTFLVRIVEIGETYGNEVVNERKPLVIFYDTDYDFDHFGQSISAYCIETLLGVDGFGGGEGGLDLYGGEPKWKIDSNTMDKIRGWLSQSYLKLASEEFTGDFIDSLDKLKNK
jgi:hypothetical protein